MSVPDKEQQEMLLGQALKIYKNNVRNIIDELNKLNLIVIEKQKQVGNQQDNENYVALLSYFSECICTLLQVNLDDFTKIDDKSLFSKEVDDWIYQTIIVKSFDGRYFPFSQLIDPLRGMKNIGGKKPLMRYL